ncbi:hypothetical protein EST38_g11826 [Candolleomyces aberdarensis]|uniref:Uncharacterized protein n=1 Tax=Candolleomyces aberdarensis TaxID=2316362 RepID=A0A4Q2D3Y5_9AGAR|nr:hypothetical protein EST38_g11826 [Candolleomyces aberdarensis]
MLEFYTTREITNHFLVTKLDIYFRVDSELKLHIGGFVVRTIINDLLDAARRGIRRPPTSPELGQVLELLDSQTHFGPDDLQLFWRNVSTAPVPPIVHQVPPIRFQTEQQPERLRKRPRRNSSPSESEISVDSA